MLKRAIRKKKIRKKKNKKKKCRIEKKKERRKRRTERRKERRKRRKETINRNLKNKKKILNKFLKKLCSYEKKKKLITNQKDCLKVPENDIINNFKIYDKNEVEDLTAYNFYKKFIKN